VLGDAVDAVRDRLGRSPARPDATREEEGDVEEVRRRLDETRERLKRQTPPGPDSS
jgi:hypothetical protein